MIPVGVIIKLVGKVFAKQSAKISFSKNSIGALYGAYKKGNVSKYYVNKLAKLSGTDFKTVKSMYLKNKDFYNNRINIFVDIGGSLEKQVENYKKIIDSVITDIDENNFGKAKDKLNALKDNFDSLLKSIVNFTGEEENVDGEEIVNDELYYLELALFKLNPNNNEDYRNKITEFYYNQRKLGYDYKEIFNDLMLEFWWMKRGQ